MKGKRATHPIASLKLRPARLTPSPRDKLVALAESWLANPIHDILVRKADLAVIDGHERLEGLKIVGRTEVEVFVVEDDVTDAQMSAVAFESAYHRSPLGGYEQAHLLRSILETELGLKKCTLAQRLRIDVSMPTKLMSLFDCIPEVQEAAKVGRLGVTDWYPISQAPKENQAELLARKLGGASRQEIARASRAARETPAESETDDSGKAITIRIAMATGQITIKGSDLTLATTAELLAAAAREVEKARNKGLSVKSAQGVWKDMAAKAKAQPAANAV